MTLSSPLEGLLVVDASNYVAGPFAATMLADLGADVVKVEAPGGDPNRRFGKRYAGIGVLFVNTNRGKRSIVLDLKQPADTEVFTGLLRRADVLLENWRPGVADRLGFGDAALEAINSRLIHVAVTGFGPDGPRSMRSAFDSLAQALSGLAWFHTRQGRPQLLRTYVADKATANFAVQATLAALLRRQRTGEAGRVDVNMLDATAYFNFPDLLDGRTVIADTEPVDVEDNPGARTLVPTKDGWIIVAPSTRAHVDRACEACGHPEWIEELKAMTEFRQLSPALMARIESVTVTGTTEEWAARFEAHDVPTAGVLDLDDHLADPQVLHNRTYGELDHPVLGGHRYARYPVRGLGENDTRRFPDLDEHGDEIRALLRSDPR